MDEMLYFYISFSLRKNLYIFFFQDKAKLSFSLKITLHIDSIFFLFLLPFTREYP